MVGRGPLFDGCLAGHRHRLFGGFFGTFGSPSPPIRRILRHLGSPSPPIRRILRLPRTFVIAYSADSLPSPSSSSHNSQNASRYHYIPAAVSRKSVLSDTIGRCAEVVSNTHRRQKNLHRPDWPPIVRLLLQNCEGVCHNTGYKPTSTQSSGNSQSENSTVILS